MNESEQSAPDEVVEETKEEKEAPKESGTKYDGGEIPKAPAKKK